MKSFDKKDHRAHRNETLSADLVIVGGGMAGVCAAITAAREQINVVLIQDRPVLGGNASSEVRLWVLGATSHMGNNNRWAREGGVIDEILVENLYRNPEGNPNFLDALLLDMVLREPNIRLLLDTVVTDITAEDNRIDTVSAYCSPSATRYTVAAPLFCDASGDGILGYLSGASFRMGAETKDEFDEPFAPDEAYGSLLGHSMYFYSRETDHPVRYVPPEFAYRDITERVTHRSFKAGESGCSLWWLEYGGKLDTVHDTGAIKTELQRVIYGLWDHIKNSGEFPEAENLTLEWVGNVPGKRESRRFEGDYMLNQRDIIARHSFDDAVSYGGWAIDLHPGDGLYSEHNGCTQWHARGVYQIPYRTMYSRNTENLFLAGRLISASHVAFGSTRVMGTCGHNAQAVGLAAAICTEKKLLPRELLSKDLMNELQYRLQRSGQHIPQLERTDPQDLATSALISASSTYALSGFSADGKENLPLDAPRALLLPCMNGSVPDCSLLLDVTTDCTLEVQLRVAGNGEHFTPDTILETQQLELKAGTDVEATLHFATGIASDRYIFICLMAAEGVSVRSSEQRLSGVLPLTHGNEAKVARSAVQQPPAGSGIEEMEFWLPARRPGGQNIAFTLSEPIYRFEAAAALNPLQRPTSLPNVWVASRDDAAPQLRLDWPAPVNLNEVVLCFDNDFDHPMETVQLGHPESIVPFCVKDFDLLDDQGHVLYRGRDNHRTRHPVRFDQGHQLSGLIIKILATHGAPAAIFKVQCFGDS